MTGAIDPIRAAVHQVLTLAGRVQNGAGDRVDLDRALEIFGTLPDSCAERPKVAAALVTAMFHGGLLIDPALIERAGSIARVANDDPAPHPAWIRTAAALRAIELTHAIHGGAARLDARAAQAEVDRLGEIIGGDPAYRELLDMTRLSIRHLIARESGSMQASLEVARAAAEMMRKYDPDTASGIRAEIMREMSEGNEAAARGRMDVSTTHLAAALALGERLPPGDGLRAALDQVRTTLAPISGVLTDPGGFPTAPSGPDGSVPAQRDPMATLRTHLEQPNVPDADRAFRYATLGTAELAEAGKDPALVRRAIASLRRAVQLSPANDPRRVHYLMTLGSALLESAESGGSAADLAESIVRLEGARDLAGGEDNPYRSEIESRLARAYRQDHR
jgi:hypothetical protein